MIDGDLRNLFRLHIKDAHWQSIETHLVSSGVPDANYCIDGVEGWIEFKFIKQGWMPRIQPGQVGWILRRTRAGGRVFIAVRRRVAASARVFASDNLYLFPGQYVRELKEQGITPQMMLHSGVKIWASSPQSWRWDEVRAALLK